MYDTFFICQSVGEPATSLFHSASNKMLPIFNQIRGWHSTLDQFAETVNQYFPSTILIAIDDKDFPVISAIIVTHGDDATLLSGVIVENSLKVQDFARFQQMLPPPVAFEFMEKYETLLGYAAMLSLKRYVAWQKLLAEVKATPITPSTSQSSKPLQLPSLGLLTRGSPALPAVAWPAPAG